MSRIDIKIFWGRYNGSMSANFYADRKQLTKITSFENDYTWLTFNIDLPSTLHVFFDGKDNSVDTKMDANGNIVADKFLKIEQIIIDYKPISADALHKICKLQTTDAQMLYTNYVGFNGVLSIDLQYSNSLLAHLHINKMLG